MTSTIWSKSEIKTLLKHLEETKDIKDQRTIWNAITIKTLLPSKSVSLCKKDLAELTRLYKYNAHNDTLEKRAGAISEISKSCLLKAYELDDMPPLAVALDATIDLSPGKLNNRWSKEEDEIILNYVKNKKMPADPLSRNDWSILASMLPARSIQACINRLKILEGKGRRPKYLMGIPAKVKGSELLSDSLLQQVAVAGQRALGLTNPPAGTHFDNIPNNFETTYSPMLFSEDVFETFNQPSYFTPYPNYPVFIEGSDHLSHHLSDSCDLFPRLSVSVNDESEVMQEIIQRNLSVEPEITRTDSISEWVVLPLESNDSSSSLI